MAEIDRDGTKNDDDDDDDDDDDGLRAVRHHAAAASPFFGFGWHMAIKGKGASFSHDCTWITRPRLLFASFVRRSSLRGVGHAAACSLRVATDEREPRGGAHIEIEWASCARAERPA